MLFLYQIFENWRSANYVKFLVWLQITEGARVEDELIELRGKLEITELFVQQVKSVHIKPVNALSCCLIKRFVCLLLSFLSIRVSIVIKFYSPATYNSFFLLKFFHICFWCLLAVLYNPWWMSLVSLCAWFPALFPALVLYCLS